MDLADALSKIRGRHHGVLTTIKSDGRPQLSNIAYALGDDGVIRISVTDGRAKTKNLRRDPRASLHVVGDSFYQYVVVEADVTMSDVTTSPDDAAADELVETYRAIAGEHDDWAEYRQAMIDDHRLVLRLAPTHAYGMWG